MQHVHHGQQGTDLHLGLRLFERLAPRAVLRRLAVLHEPGRDRPEAEPRLDGAPTEQDAAFVLGHAADDQLRVLVVDDAAGLADVPRRSGRLRACGARPGCRRRSRTSWGRAPQLVPGEGIEPSRVISSPDFESGASTSSAIPARGRAAYPIGVVRWKHFYNHPVNTDLAPSRRDFRDRCRELGRLSAVRWLASPLGGRSLPRRPTEACDVAFPTAWPPFWCC